MTRRHASLLAASHLLVLIAGGAFGLHSRSTHTQGSAVAMSSPDELPIGAAALKSRPSREWDSSGFARAWGAVPDGVYTTRERVKLQRALLARWAAVDLRAAIEAALGEAWDRDGGADVDRCGPLLDAISPALAKNPKAGWELVRGRQFGVGTGMLRRLWIDAVGTEDPLFLAARMDKLSWRDRPHALDVCEAAVHAPEARVTESAIFTALARHPERVVTAADLVRFATHTTSTVADLDAQRAEVERLAGENRRRALVGAMLYGKSVAARPADEIEARLAELPDVVRTEATWSAFKEVTSQAAVLPLASALVAEEAWPQIEEPEMVGHLQKLARTGDARAVAEWATTLPVRAETIELFHSCVEPFLSGDPDVARDWLEELEPGTWRDRAFAEFSQVALNVRQNPRDSRWALSQIADDRFKAEAEDWRVQWEKRFSQAGQ